MLHRVALVRTDVSEELNLRRLLVRASVVPSSPILVTLMKEALSSSETPVLTRATRRNIPEDTILLSSLCLHCSHRVLNIYLIEVVNVFPLMKTNDKAFLVNRKSDTNLDHCLLYTYKRLLLNWLISYIQNELRQIAAESHDAF
jgi:hypothetical protein